MRALLLIPCLAVLTATGVVERVSDAVDSAELVKRAAVIKPAAEELKWQRIPWVTDLAAAQRAAIEEKRPIFLWVTGDDPLERC